MTKKYVALLTLTSILLQGCATHYPHNGGNRGPGDAIKNRPLVFPGPQSSD